MTANKQTLTHSHTQSPNVNDTSHTYRHSLAYGNGNFSFLAYGVHLVSDATSAGCMRICPMHMTRIQFLGENAVELEKHGVRYDAEKGRTESVHGYRIDVKTERNSSQFSCCGSCNVLNKSVKLLKTKNVVCRCLSFFVEFSEGFFPFSSLWQQWTVRCTKLCGCFFFPSISISLFICSLANR